jgi:hypothetical protein
VRDYFIQSNNQHFGLSNHALAELEDKEKKQTAKEMEQKERERSKFHLYYIGEIVYCQSHVHDTNSFVCKDAPVVVSEMSTQTEHEVIWDGTDIPYYDGNLLMSFVRLENFIWPATAHSSKCGKQLVLRSRQLDFGAKVQHLWKCPCCSAKLCMVNCDMIRSSEVAEGAAYSRSQPDFNLRIVKGAQLTGINTKKVLEFMQGEMGIKIASDRNLCQQITKARKSIVRTDEDWKVQNRKEHVLAVRSADTYKGDVQWSDNGKQHSTSAGNICIDGAGCTRVYNNRHRGRQSAAVANSCVAKKPLAWVVSQVSTMRSILSTL